MASNWCYSGMQNWLSTIERETMDTLRAMKRDLKRLEPSRRYQFKIDFLKMANYRFVLQNVRFTRHWKCNPLK